MNHLSSFTSEQEKPTDINIKIVVIGESGVGKTNIITRYTSDSFNINTLSTIGVDLFTKKMQSNNYNVTLNIWDTAGQERMKALASSYYKAAKGVILVYDISSKESFDRLRFWLKELRNSGGENVKVVIIGNKNDLFEQRQVSDQEAKKFADEKSYFYMEVSAKTNDQNCVGVAVNALIDEITKDLNDEELAKMIKESELLASVYNDIQANRTPVGNENKKKCC